MGEETHSLRAEPFPKTFGFRLPSILGGGLWALSAKIASQAAQLAGFIVAARLLTPTEFGFFAFTSAVAVFLVVLSEGGWGEFIMKSHEEETRMRQVVTLSIASGLLFTAVGLTAAAIFCAHYDKRWEGGLLALFSLWILPSALTAVYDGALVHRGHLHKQAVIRIVAETGGLAVTIGGLFAGWNVFALVIGRLAMQGLLLGGSVLAVGWIWPTGLTRHIAGEVLQFSRHILTNRLIVFLRSYSGTLAVGGFLGLTEAGFYRAAERIVAAFSELVGEPARLLSWIVFRRARDGEQDVAHGPDAVTAAGNTFLPVLFAIAAPTYLGLALVSGSLVDAALGSTWEPAALLVCILAAKQLLLIPSYVTEPLLSIRGAVRKLPPFSLLNGAVSVGLILALAPFGVLAVALGQCLAAIVAFSTSVWMQGRYGKLDWGQIARNSAVLPGAVAAMLLCVFYIGRFAEQSEFRSLSIFALQVCVGVVVYLAALGLIWKLSGAAQPAFVLEKR